MSEDVKAKMQKYVADAKGFKAARDDANADYKHVMSKLESLHDAYPEIAAELGIEFAERKPRGPRKAKDETPTG